MADAIEMLIEDHEKVKKLFADYEDTTDRAIKTRRRIVDEVTEELSVHQAIEEQVLYPVTRAISDDAEAQSLESLEEHHLVSVALSELASLDPEDERFNPKMVVLMENVRHHVDEEEQELFPMLRKAVDKEELDEMAKALEDARQIAPTRPHPAMPDTPPGNVLVGAVAGLVDRIRDKVGV
ncbi:MAG: hemerythrin domain-containing protein [Microthrixaceae bacterium]